jgi:hypothetical protein
MLHAEMCFVAWSAYAVVIWLSLAQEAFKEKIFWRVFSGLKKKKIVFCGA